MSHKTEAKAVTPEPVIESFHTRGDVILQIPGELPEEEAKKYDTALQSA